MRIAIALSVGVFFAVQSLAATTWYKYRIYLSDKNGSSYSVEAPLQFLSPKAVERKMRQGIKIDSTDFPVNSSYLELLQQNALKVVVTSRWMNTVVVMTSDSCAIEQVARLPFVQSVRKVWMKNISADEYLPKLGFERVAVVQSNDSVVENRYGEAFDQIALHQGEKLHQSGFTGRGVAIAVIDAGFLNVNHIGAFEHTRFIGTKNFVEPDSSVFTSHYHGQRVLSAIAAQTPGRMVGTAPDADYLLLQTEDSDSEFPVEEDYWTAAVEYADSIGVDVVTSSLGYSTFDDGVESYTYEDLDGRRAFITRAATTAAEKGLLMILSAGNEANGTWANITFPADSRRVLTVGAIDRDRQRSSFSSFGPTADSRQKPDVVSIGGQTVLLDSDGSVISSNGTSYSTPIVAGLAACLKQALPQLSNQQLIDLIKQSGDHAVPQREIGWGVPNFYKAYQQGLKLQPLRR